MTLAATLHPATTALRATHVLAIASPAPDLLQFAREALWAAQEPSRRAAYQMDTHSLMEEEWHGCTSPHAPARQQPM